MSAEYCTLYYQVAAAAVILNPGYTPEGAPYGEVALLACAVLGGVLLVLASIPTILRLLIRDSNYFITSVKGYWTPNVPLLGSLLVAIYSALSIATALIARQHLQHFSNVAIGQQLIHLAVLLPTPHFLWAWVYAMGAASSFHTITEVPLSQHERPMGRMSPVVHNIVFTIVPLIAITTSVITLPILITNTSRSENAAGIEVVKKYGFKAPASYWQEPMRQCRTSDYMYRSLWAIWGVFFLVAMTVYVWYARQLYNNLQSGLASLKLEVAASEQSHVMLRKEPLQQSLSTTSRDSEKCQSESGLRVATFRVVRQNLVLGRVEMVVFSMYCLPWLIIGIYKALRGYDTFLKTKLWVGLLCLEVILAFICNAAQLCVVTWRSYHLYFSQKRYTTRSRKRTLQVTVQTDQFEVVDDQDEFYLAFEGDANGAYSDYPDIAQLYFSNTTLVQLPASTSKTTPEADWSAPEGWDSSPPTTPLEKVKFSMLDLEKIIASDMELL